MGVTVGRKDLEDAIGQLHDGDIERSTTEIVHRHLAGFFLVETVSQRGRGRFVDYPFDIEPGDFAGILVACRCRSL